MALSGCWRSSCTATIAVALCLLACGCNALIGITDVPEAVDATTDGPEAAAFESGGASDVAMDESRTDADASADAAPETSPCGDTQSSQTNCGRCGHDCLGASCKSGACQPLALVPLDSGVSPSMLAQDDTFLYWTDYTNGSISRTDKVSGGVTALASAFFPSGIADDEAGIYWGEATGVYGCTKAGCVLDTTLIASEMHAAVGSIAIDDVSLYWSEGFGFLLTASKDGGGQTPTTLWQGDASVANVTTDGQRVYFTADDGLLHVVGVDGGSPFAIGLPNAQGSIGVALDTVGVSWSGRDPAMGTIERADLASLAPSTLTMGQSYPSAITSDGTNVYWLATTAPDGATGAGIGCTIASCTPTVLATSASPTLTSIVVDQRAIYFTEQGTSNIAGGVWKLAK
jgi:hypothetical protein